MAHFEETLSSETIFRGKIINLRVDKVRLENGETAVREVVEHPGGVCVLAVDGEDNVLFVRQFRYPYKEELLELPAGKMEPGEDPAKCGIRELEEETGCRAGSFQPLAKVYPTAAYVTEVLHLYLARDLTPARQHLDADEFLTVEKIPVKKALELCLSGEIRDAKTLVALLKYGALNGLL